MEHPRLYIMGLYERGLRAEKITRHCRVTQCLAAMGGKEWLIAVAPPIAPDDHTVMPDPEAIRAFRVPGMLAIKLHRGTWHAGPYFTASTVDFLNLEPSDTNETDHVNCYLTRDLGIALRFEIRMDEPPMSSDRDPAWNTGPFAACRASTPLISHVPRSSPRPS